MNVAVFARDTLTGELTAAERAELGRLGFAGERANEWIGARLAAHRVLGARASVLADADGAPRVVDRDIAISISHDDAWVAVATGVRAVAVDLCARSREPRLARILARLEICADDPCVAWAMLECALKLRRLGVWNLVDASLSIDGDHVLGIGAPVRVAAHVASGYALAWTEDEREQEVAA